MKLLKLKYINILILCLFIITMSFFLSCEKDEFVPVQAVSNLPAGCDTSAVKYSTTIKSIMSSNCTGCHGTIGGVNLESYDNVKKYVDNGQLLAKLDIKNGVPGGMYTYLDKKKAACILFQLKAWINKGAPND